MAAVKKLKFTNKEVLKLCEQVKSHFASQPGRYRTFLIILEEFRENRFTESDVIEQVNILLGHSPELIAAFQVLLPLEENITVIKGKT